MIEKLKKFDLDISDIEKLNAFESRDGFALLDDAEFDEMANCLARLPIYRHLLALLTDGNSNYWCVNTDGAMKGMICYLSHDEPDLAPKFKNISRFLQAINENPEADDFYDLAEDLFDFPNSGKQLEFDERKKIIETLQSDFTSEADEDIQTQIAFSIIALTSIDEIEENIFPFLDDEDMYIQERAIQILGFHQYKPAKEKLMELKKTAMPNGQTAIKTALEKLDGN
ncbi:MAG: hypothetical protein Q4G28_12170 [Neisseria sp.]|nr:hypothetical protein [Neisseria sp.]